MLPRIILFALQLAAAWYLAPAIKAALPVLVARPNEVFVYAVLYALIIVFVGFAGSLILKDVPTPSATTLVVSLVLALILAGITWVPQILQPIEQAVPALRTNRNLYPLLGAILGYYVRR